MKTTFYTIYNYFKNHCVLSNILESAKDIPLIEAKLIVKNQSLFKNNLIYVATTDFIIKNNINLKDAKVILIDHSQGKYPIDNLKDATYFILENSCDLFDTFNKINGMFTENNALNSLQNNTGLENIMEISSQILNNPMIFIDNSYHILATSDTLQILDNFWIENIKRGYCSYDFITYIRNMDTIKNSLNTSTPFQVNFDKSPIEHWVTRVFVQGKASGYIITLLSNCTMDEKAINILPFISEVTAKVLESDINWISIGNMDYKNLLMDLLDNKIKNSKNLKEKLKSYKKTFEKNFKIIVLDINNFDETKKATCILSQKLEILFYKKIHIYYENHIVLLYDFNYNPFISTNELKNIETLAEKNQIILGISTPFNNLLDCRIHLNEAIKSIEINKKMNLSRTLNYYENIKFYDFIYNASKTLNIEDFIHPSLDILKLYDKKNNTDLYNTLYVYLKNNQNTVFTSKELFVHRNTVNYRIDRIIQLTNIDFKNTDQIFQIFFSYKSLLCINL
jgi:hypothetical protein